jgi:hypothetical protein
MKTILSIYQKSGKESKPSAYSKQEVVTKHKSKLIVEAQSVADSKFPDLTRYESNYDLDQTAKYLS